MCVDKMDLSVQHLSELVNDVLDMSKIESGYLELQNDTFDLNTLIDQVEVVVSAQVEAMEISYESHREKGESYDAERRYAADQKNYAESVQ